jgi:hypothetical protein
MKLDKIGTWLQVSANLGILLGLVMVGLQMKQNSDLLKIQLSYEESSRYAQNERVLWGENPSEVWAKSIETPEDLTFAEQRIIESIVWAGVQEWYAVYELSTLGLIGNEWKDRIDNEGAFWLGNRYGRAWWKLNSENQFDDEFVEAISEALKAQPNRTKVYMNMIMENLRKDKNSENEGLKQ